MVHREDSMDDGSHEGFVGDVIGWVSGPHKRGRLVPFRGFFCLLECVSIIVDFVRKNQLNPNSSF